MIHEHIVSFFDYVNMVSMDIDLSPFSIFSDLNTIKTLIVFFNWLGKTECYSSSGEVEDEEESRS